MDGHPFDPHRMLALLDDLQRHVGSSSLPSIEAAWDAAWVACLSGSVRHEGPARVAFATVVLDLSRLCVRPERAWDGAAAVLTAS